MCVFPKTIYIFQIIDGGCLSSMSQTVTALVTRGMSWDAHEDKLDPKIRKKVLELQEKLVKVSLNIFNHLILYYQSFKLYKK